jgi:hypothetical protein
MGSNREDFALLDCPDTMEQTAEQTRDEASDQMPWRFRPGQSGNRLGRASPRIRTVRQAEAFTAEFARIHRRDPGATEAVCLRNAAALAVSIERSLSAADQVRLTNALRRVLKSLGLDQPPEHKPVDPFDVFAGLTLPGMPDAQGQK